MKNAFALSALLPLGFMVACSNGNGGSTDAAPDAVLEGGGADVAEAGQPEAGQHCTGIGAVCASGSGFSCAQQFATQDCFGGTCCIVAPDGGPPYYDDAGTCPGMCASPDDIGCPNWYRSNTCTNGTACCVLHSPADAGDAATD